MNTNILEIEMQRVKERFIWTLKNTIYIIAMLLVARFGWFFLQICFFIIKDVFINFREMSTLLLFKKSIELLIMFFIANALLWEANVMNKN